MKDWLAWARRWPAILFLVIVAVVIIGGIYWCWPRSVTTVVLVRHAEPDTAGPPGNPPLSPAGQARAEKLVHVLGEAGVTAVFSSEFTRTQQTVQPLATARGLAVIQMPASDVAALVSEIRTNHRGGVVLVAGHSNTVPEIIEALGGPAMAALGDEEFDNLFVVTLCRGRTKVLRLKYGDET